MKLSSN